MALHPHNFMTTMIDRVCLTDEDKNMLSSSATWGLQIAPEMANHFYAYMGRDAEMNAILNATEGRIHRLHETFVKWFHEMFIGIDNWGNGYADCRWNIGLIHVRIGIGPQHVVPAMATVIREVGNRCKQDQQPEELRDALSKICMIDLAFIEQAYIEVSSNAVLQETGWTEGLFRRLIATGANAL